MATGTIVSGLISTTSKRNKEPCNFLVIMTTVTQNQNFRREKEIGDLWEQFYSPIVCCGSPGQVLPSLSLESKSCLLSLRGLVHTSDRTVLW